MRTYMIAGNWKMHGSKQSVATLLAEIKASLPTDLPAEWVVFPPFVYLEKTQLALTGTHIAWGGQNCAEHAQGAFTGEVAATMLTEFGCQYVIVGHSERRHLLNESNQTVAAKFIRAQAEGLTPILCLGETQSERESGLTQQVVLAQLEAVLQLASGVQVLQNAVLAYEPVWAIGTGLTATPEQAQAVHLTLRAAVAEHDSVVADKLRILYGGSVKPCNAASLFAMPDIDGGLIGGASLDAKTFVEIGQCIK